MTGPLALQNLREGDTGTTLQSPLLLGTQDARPQRLLWAGPSPKGRD